MRHLSPSGFATARRAFLAGLLLCVGASALAATDSLVARSPFLPPGWGEKQEAPAPVVAAPPTIISRQLEFKGLIELDGVTRFSVFDKKANEGHWLELNESAGDFQIVRFDSARQSILISSGGRTEELALASPDESPMQISGSVTPSVRKPSTPGAPVTQASSTSGSSGRAGPLIPRRRLIRPKDSSTATTTQEERRTDTPASPLPPPPAS
ncbi:MAG: hypothetical protein Q7Q73_11745 [Verrucomicrobiota bacterium JB024]|jgi:hypothetical protein|nr:hypothetical protein [Verrucomicrobiota bacterium JB024]